MDPPAGSIEDCGDGSTDSQLKQEAWKSELELVGTITFKFNPVRPL